MDANVVETNSAAAIGAEPTSAHSGKSRVNIADTPGHADIDDGDARVLSTSDGEIASIDAAQSPLAVCPVDVTRLS